MRRTDLSLDRRQLLVPVKTHPGAFALVPPPTPGIGQLVGLRGIQDEVTRARIALGNLQMLSKVLPNPDLATRTTDRREAVRSSQIEGTGSDLNDLFTFEATGSDEGLPPDVQVTLNYLTSLEFGLQQVRQRGPASMSKKLIEDLHARLMNGSEYSWKPGVFRDKQNWIGGGRCIDQARFVPPPAENIDACIADLLSILQYSPSEEDQVEMSIVTRMAVVHAQFETIHPFFDGNGRVGRILLPLMLAAEGYPPVYLAGYLKDNQREYYDALAGVQLQSKWADWIKFFARGVESAVQESIGTALGLEAILKRWKDIIEGSGTRKQAVLYRFPELMIGTPVLTAHKAKDALGISFPSASAALKLMEEYGILTQQNNQRRNRIFYAKEVIELLNKPSSLKIN